MSMTGNAGASALRMFGLGLLLASSAAALGSGAARAETATDYSNDGLSEVVVVAEKRLANLQDTPISISVLDSTAMSNRHAQSLEDLGDGSIPSLRVAPFFARSSALTVGMRGVGAMGDANQPSRDQGVGVYLDGVYLGRAQGLGTALYDVERIEVLKGPQGTLFGRNTEGGAISIITRKPTGEFGISATAGYGNFDGRRLEAHVNLPSFAGVAVKLDGLLSSRDGTTDNPLAGQKDFNGYDKRGFRVEALWTPFDGFSVDYAYDYGRDATSPYYVQLYAKGSLATAPLVTTQTERAKTALLGVPMEASVGKTDGHALTLDWKVLDALEIKSITSYRMLTQTQRDNGAVVLSVFSPNGNFGRYSLSNTKQHQFSQEIQLIGEFPEIHYAAGAYYYREYAEENAWTPNTLQWNATGTAYSVLATPVAAWPFPDRASFARTESTGIFAQGTWSPGFLDAKMHLTLGGRYSSDHKAGELNRVNGAIPVVNGVAAIQTLNKTWNRFDPLVTLAYDLTTDISVYGKWSTGYKAGGANSRSLTYRAFDPESVETYEIGAKTEFFDHHARLNIAAYTGTYSDVQIDFNAVIPGNNRGTLETVNTAGAADIRGVEVELSVVPVEGLTLSLNYAHTEIDLPPAPNPFASNVLVKVRGIYAPRNAGSLSADYELPVGFATVRAHADANYADGQYTSPADPTLSQSSMIVNGKLSLGDIALGGKDNLDVSLWARNLFDEQHLFVKNFNSSLGTYAIFNDPRTFGFEAKVRF